MKKQFLILLSTLAFVILFYYQDLALNFSIFALLLATLNFVQKPDLRKDKKALLLFFTIVLCAFSNAWLTSAATVFSLVISSFVFRYYCVQPRLKLVSQMLINVFNWFSFVLDVFRPNEWIESEPNARNKFLIKVVAYFLLPIVILTIFFSIYISSSDTLLAWYNAFELNIDSFIIGVALLGFYVSFVFWNSKIVPAFAAFNDGLKNEFSENIKTNPKPTFRFLPVAFELQSGIITLFCLNIMLLCFIVVFNIEHLQPADTNFSAYSARIHEQIYLIIVSIVFAMLLILFYFKGSLNFILNNKYLLVWAKVWVILNALLVTSAFYQNTVYVLHLGLTYKRLGVYLFLLLCFLGLLFTYKKIQNKRKNFYLIDKMTWSFYYALIACALVNWSTWITKYNLTLENTDWYYLEQRIEGNEKVLINYYRQKNEPVPEFLSNRVRYYQGKSFFSSQIYYLTIRLEE